MLTIQRYADLGRANHGWLDAHFHFSFSNYYNPQRMGFGPLRVINDDIINAGGGFAPHPHRDMEIITFVRAGAITHEDSMGNRGKTAAGDIQVMSAGTGVTHSEWNEEGEATRLYQIWIEPRHRGNAPRWETRSFPKNPGALHLLSSGRAEHAETGAIPIDQDASIWGGVLPAGQTWTQDLPNRTGYVLVSRGSVTIDGQTLQAGDGAEIRDQSQLSIATIDESEMVLIDLPPITH